MAIYSAHCALLRRRRIRPLTFRRVGRGQDCQNEYSVLFHGRTLKSVSQCLVVFSVLRRIRWTASCSAADPF